MFFNPNYQGKKFKHLGEHLRKFPVEDVKLSLCTGVKIYYLLLHIPFHLYIMEIQYLCTLYFLSFHTKKCFLIWSQMGACLSEKVTGSETSARPQMTHMPREPTAVFFLAWQRNITYAQ